MSGSPSRGPWSALAGWLVGGLLLSAMAVIAGLGAAYLVSTGQAVPTVDVGQLATPTPAPTATPPPPDPAPTPAPTPSPTAMPGATSTAEPQVTASPVAATPRVHVVARGETLTRIAARYGVTVAEIVELNDLANPDQIVVGQVLLIPPP